jgi:SPASM domain peptide maturase of grasp-with-spasm system
MVKKENYIKLFANCIPVKGKNRSAICDLQRNSVKLIPNDLYNLLQDKISNIKTIKANYNNDFDDTIDEYFEFLIEHEFAFKTNTPELFPEMSLDWFEPAITNNAIIDISKDSTFDVFTMLDQLDDFNCKNIQIRYYRDSTIKEITTIIEYLDKNEMFITSVDFIFPILKIKNLKEIYQELIKKHKRINSIINYNAQKKEFIESINEFNRGYIVFVEETIISQKSCGIISSKFFTPNIKTFTESQSYNSCLNKKISIDTNGNIRNCPSMPQSFGNINDTTLEQALNHKDFKKYWDITKDKIDVCKDCEFRYVCTDCRAYIEKPDDIYSKPLKCGYNPYTNEWSEWSTNPLKQKAIEYYGIQELVKKDNEV